MDKTIDTNTATIVGFWIGIASFFLGIASIALALYAHYTNEPIVFMLTASGWCATLLCSITFGYVFSKIVRLTSTLSLEVTRLNFDLANLQNENRRLIEIDAYIVSKAVRAKATPRTPQQETNLTPEALGGESNA